MSTAKKNTKKTGRKQAPKPTNRKPRILVLEGLSKGASCVRRAGGEPITVNPRDIAAVDAALLGDFDGLLLTGGGDVDPRLYGEKPHAKVYGVSELRDYTEWSALDEAQARGVPVLGICRGSQLMAVHNGGRLKQHIGGHRGVDHLVFAEQGSTFGRFIGARAPFVSLHHQVVLRHGPGWRVAGRDYSGNIEATESKDGRCLAVQFHPEMDYHRNEPSRRLFDWLTAESAQRAGLVAPRRVRMTPQRPADAPALPNRRTTRRRPVLGTRWFCRDCGLMFDVEQDRDDHEFWVCGSPELRTTEPPPGHPDWMGSAS